MPDTNPSTNMNMPIPVVGVDSGPDWANNLNACLTIVDSHTHASGSGVQITPSGMNINADLSYGNNNAVQLRTVRFSVQNSTPAVSSDLGCLYETGVDLYFIDGNGNNVRITQSGGIAGSPGSIANLTSPASASYVSGTATFVWQSDVNIAANLDARNVILRNSTASSKGLTLSPPNAMGADYTITLPALPAASKILQINTSGTISANVDADNSTLQFTSNLLSIKAAGVNTTQLHDAAVTIAKIDESSVFPTFQSQTFTSSGTFTVPGGVSRLIIYARGAGGGGGGAGGAASGAGSGGGGGGCGSYPNVQSLGCSPADAITVTIGAGGAGGVGGETSFAGAAGSKGGDTIVGALTFRGGAGGGGGASSGGSGGGSSAGNFYDNIGGTGGDGGAGNGGATGRNSVWNSGGAGGSGSGTGGGGGGGGAADGAGAAGANASNVAINNGSNASANSGAGAGGGGGRGGSTGKGGDGGTGGSGGVIIIWGRFN